MTEAVIYTVGIITGVICTLAILHFGGDDE